MKLRGLMLGTLVLVALAAGVYFSNKQKSAEAAKPPTDAPPKILALPDGDITKIALRKHDADEIILEKNAAGKWQITFPKPYGADQDAAGQLATRAGQSFELRLDVLAHQGQRKVVRGRRARMQVVPDGEPFEGREDFRADLFLAGALPNAGATSIPAPGPVALVAIGAVTIRSRHRRV